MERCFMCRPGVGLSAISSQIFVVAADTMQIISALQIMRCEVYSYGVMAQVRTSCIDEWVQIVQWKYLRIDYCIVW